MPPSVQLRQVTSIQPGPLYRVMNEILAATGIDAAVFVYKTSTQAFDHYALVADMEQYSNSYDSAVLNGDLYYRQTSVTRDWDTVTLMNDDLNITRARVQALLNQMGALQGTIPSDTTVTLTGVS